MSTIDLVATDGDKLKIDSECYLEIEFTKLL